GAEGLGFATPIDIAREVAEDLITDGKVQHVWLGIQGQDVDADTAAALGIDGGALVREVVDDSPAAAAELRNDDVIVAIDGRPIANMSALVVALRRLDPGTTVELTVRRGGEQLAIDVTVAERPDDLEED
ncbi:MAG: S1C family serine protease, partial [Actinomycetota bacterium]